MKLNSSLVFFSFILLALSPNLVIAQGPPIYTDTPILLGLEGSGIRTFSKFVKQEEANIYIQPIIIPYNITSRILIGVIVPLVNKNPSNLASRFGIGDIALVIKKTLYQKATSMRQLSCLIKFNTKKGLVKVTIIWDFICSVKVRMTQQ